MTAPPDPEMVPVRVPIEEDSTPLPIERRSAIKVVVALGITQIIGYGTLYYSFSILADDMAGDFGWSTEWIFAVLSAALLVGGLAAPLLGRWIDRFGAGRAMTAGSILAAIALIACACALNGPSFILALIAIQVASNLVQYGAAFALLVQIGPGTAQRSIVHLTLIGGFASTVFWPVTTALHAYMPWQGVYLIFAALNLVVAVPLHAWLSKRRTTVASTAEPPVRHLAGSLGPSRRHAGFIIMVSAFALQSLISAAILVHMIPLLSGLGLGTMAAVVGTLFGPSQVLSRFVTMIMRQQPPLRLAAISAGLMTAGVAVLDAATPSTAAAMAFAVIFGMGNGLFSIVTGTLPLVLFGSEGYGRLQGRAMAARLIVSAVAPFAFAAVMVRLGVPASLLIVVVLGLAALLLLAAIGRLVKQDRNAAT